MFAEFLTPPPLGVSAASHLLEPDGALAASSDARAACSDSLVHLLLDHRLGVPLRLQHRPPA
eukprot:1090227-Prymnesium_polylepis.1